MRSLCSRDATFIDIRVRVIVRVRISVRVNVRVSAK